MRRALAAALALLAACGTATGPGTSLPDAGAPRTLVYSAGGFGGTLSSVRLAGDTVVLVRRPFFNTADSSVSRRVPTAAEWRTFWEAARAVGVGRWPGRCTNPNVVDGGGFSFELAWDGGRRAGSYSNAYPTRAGRCRQDPTATTEAASFQDAVFAMAGVVVN